MIKKLALLGTVIGLIFSLPAISAPPPGAPTVNDKEAWDGLTPAAVEKIKKGEIVIASAQTTTGGGGEAMIQAAMIFDVNIAEAFRIIKETDKQCEFLNNCDEAILIERTDTHDIIEFRVKILAWELKYRVKHRWDNKKFRMWWTLDPSFNNDLKHLEGFWQLFYIDDTHTLGRYGTKLIVKEFIPKSVQEALTKRDLPTVLEQFRKRVNSHGKFKKKGA